jgi:4-amino-4-deoxy-L-arabinose transferase-like glycosyltransferase
MRRPPEAVVVAGIVTAVFLVQLPFRLHAVNLVDEPAVYQDAVDILSGRKMYVDSIHPAFPGVFYFTALVFAIAGASFDVGRTLACLVFAGTTGVVYLIGRWWLRPLGGLALVILLVNYRLWAYPHWHMMSYSSLAIAFVLAATWVLGVAFRRGRAVWYALAGAVAALAMVTKQDSGLLGTAALGLAILVAAPVAIGARLRAATAFVAGVAAVFGTALALIVWAGMLPALIQHAIVAPIHGFRHFTYQGSPPLWPPWGQDPAMRERAFSYLPTILLDVAWQTVTASPLFRDTALPDVAMRLAYHLPWLVLIAASPIMLRDKPHDRVRRARERLVVIVAAACWLAFSRPHDWVHLLVLYPPVLLLLSLFCGRLMAFGPVWRRIGVVVVTLVLAGATIVSATLAMALRRTMSAPVRGPRGTIYATPPQAASLQDLVDGLANAAPPGVPVSGFPYHPIVNFMTARPPLTRYYPIWPGEPDHGRTETVEREFDARPDGLVVYSQSQVPMFQRMPEYAPDLSGYLADHYALERSLGGQPLGFEFLLFRRKPPAVGRPLTADELARARVDVEPAAGVARPASPDERARLVGTTIWPFLRVLRVTTEPGATVAVRVPLVPGPTTRVHTSYGVNPDHWSHLPRAALRFAVAVAADGRETTISESTLDPVYFRRDRRWPEVDVDLAPYAGRPVELVLRVTAPADVPPLDDRAGFVVPRVVE